VEKALHLAEAAKEIGVSQATLKRWLLQGKVSDVGRDRNGWRDFTPEDIARIRAYANSSEQPQTAREDSSFSPGSETTQYRAASFFSGIGGFDLGFEDAGYEITMQCEIEPFCTGILKKHWPDVLRHSDIKELSGDDIPVSDVWIGGFPCQDLSLARMGKRDGLKGSKSRLFYEFARLVGECQPRVLLLENVSGLLSSHRGRDLGLLLSALAELGYAVGWRTLNSRYFGVPQSRRRVYIVGCRGDGRGPAKVLFEPECSNGNLATGGSNGKKSPSPFQKVVGDPSGEGPVIQSIAYCLYATSARHTGTDWSRNYVCYPSAGMVRRLIPSECEGVMAFPQGWTVPDTPELSGDDLDSARYHALGNAVTPPVARWLAGRIHSYLLESDQEIDSRLYSRSNDGLGQSA
jgi:DNA (cytosine-5)-methyltransferase 1